MKTLNYKEVYFTSSECSALNNQPGIGVRTYTEGMDSKDVDKIVGECVKGYYVDADKRLTLEQIQENPKIVYDYPPFFIYRAVTLDDGSVKYVFGRTVYIGIDYGYFTPNEANRRTGTNYFTHLFIFDEFPPFSAFAEIEAKGLYRPFDYTCAPDNPELQELLTGTPEFLRPQEMEFPEISDIAVSHDNAQVALALMQAFRNEKLSREESLTKVLVKYPEEKAAELVYGLSALPKTLTETKTFLTNWREEQGVPDGFNMAFALAADLDFVRNFVYVDLTTGETANIEDNYIFTKILELAKDGDSATVKKLVDYYLNLELWKELDYNFLYNLFIAVESDKDVSIDDISGEFIRQLGCTRLTPQQEGSLWYKINGTLNAALKSTHGADVMKALTAIGHIRKENEYHLAINQDEKSWLTKILFEENSYFGKIVNTGNVVTVIYLLDRTGIISEELFYKALNQSADITLWQKFIDYYYDGNLNTNIDAIVENVMNSSLPKESKDKLVNLLFPVGKCRNELLSYFMNNISRIPEMMTVVKEICLNSNEECFSLIISQSGNDAAVISSLSPLVSTYYENIIRREPNKGMTELLAFIEKVSVDVFNMMSVPQIFSSYVDGCLKEPTKNAQKALEGITASGVKLDKATAAKIDVLKCLFENEVPKKVDTAVFHAALKMNKKAEYLRELYEAWLKEFTRNDELKDLIVNAEGLTSEVIEEMVLATWESRVRMVRENRKDYILIILDNASWNSGDKKKFIKSCRDKELKEYLGDSEKLFKKLFRKMLNLVK